MSQGSSFHQPSLALLDADDQTTFGPKASDPWPSGLCIARSLFKSQQSASIQPDVHHVNHHGAAHTAIDHDLPRRVLQAFPDRELPVTTPARRLRNLKPLVLTPEQEALLDYLAPKRDEFATLKEPPTQRLEKVCISKAAIDVEGETYTLPMRRCLAWSVVQGFFVPCWFLFRTLAGQTFPLVIVCVAIVLTGTPAEVYKNKLRPEKMPEEKLELVTNTRSQPSVPETMAAASVDSPPQANELSDNLSPYEATEYTASQLIANGRYAEAIALYEKLVKLYPDQPVYAAFLQLLRSDRESVTLSATPLLEDGENTDEISEIEIPTEVSVIEDEP